MPAGWIILSRYEKIMSFKLTYGYLTTINWFQYFFVFNLYRRMNKFEYISENSHTVVPESCLYYLTIDNWFHNIRLFDLQWTIWMYLVTYNLFNIDSLKEEKTFLLVFILFLWKNHKYYHFIDYTEKTSILGLFYTFIESFILRILLFVQSWKIITIYIECLLNRWD